VVTETTGAEQTTMGGKIVSSVAVTTITGVRSGSKVTTIKEDLNREEEGIRTEEVNGLGGSKEEVDTAEVKTIEGLVVTEVVVMVAAATSLQATNSDYFRQETARPKKNQFLILF
jgi:hypothetical protein